MAGDSTIVAKGSSPGPKADLSTSCGQCDPVRGSYGLSVADAAGRFSELEHGLRGFLEMAKRGYLAKNPRRLAGESTAICPNSLWTRTAPRGTIPCVRIGTSVLYDPRDLAAWRDAQKTGVHQHEQHPPAPENRNDGDQLAVAES